MKIWCQLPISMPKDTYGGYYELLMQDYNLFKDEETEITVQDVPTGMKDGELISYLGFREVNDAETIKSMLRAELEGYDAVAGACYFEGGIKAVRNLLSIPVVGPAEAAMTLASIMGNSFAVVTSERAWIPAMEQHLKELGFRQSAICNKPVRSLTIAFKEFINHMKSGDFSPIIDNFSNISKKCMEDDAEIIIAGCGLMSPILTTNGIREIDGAPIIDPMIVSLKFAELMVKLSKAGVSVKSKRGLFDIPSNERRIRGLRELRLL